MRRKLLISRGFCVLGLIASLTTAALAQDEAKLWQQIRELGQPPASQPSFLQWYDAVAAARSALIQTTRLYLTLYPGGEWRDEVTRLELSALFELATLHEARLARLCDRAAALLAAGPSEAVADEAAYWLAICGQAEQTWSRPHSRYLPRLAELAFEQAAKADDVVGMARIVGQMRAAFPTHGLTARLEAEYQRAAARGQPFWPPAGLALKQIDAAGLAGHPVLLVVWAGYDERSRSCARQVADFCKAHAEFRAIGVSLDESRAATAAAARELALNWPQISDELGWGGEFVRRWGVREIPYVFAIGRDGRLLGAADSDAWAELARSAVVAPAAPTTFAAPAHDGTNQQR